jgi:hypothetical protein
MLDFRDEKKREENGRGGREDKMREGQRRE